ncbi:isoprenylcysteine carboxylmethyltransferase family protein [Microbulbifer sp. HZ11]|uniref:methyltransferase family protein n=1 Tax=Microbulbifer sp. HZ11 TaxID=1453501 RepID=UPI0005BBAF00|nr:isoprenylcysteine carboxylmethyltransferase family protein [Microbulbifer sp. HZ11]
MRIVLPPTLFVLFIIIMGAAWWQIEPSYHLAFPYNLIGLLFIASGLILSSSGKALFRKLDTNIMTFDKPDKLVTEGAFKHTRNPMYLGLVGAMLGFSLLMGATILSMVLTVLFFLIIDRWYIAFEERVMLRKFGKDYETYCRKVRRWI